MSQTVMATFKKTVASKAGTGLAQSQNSKKSKLFKKDLDSLNSKNPKNFVLNKETVVGAKSFIVKTTALFYEDISDLSEIQIESKSLKKIYENITLTINPNPIGEGTFSMVYDCSCAVESQNDAEFGMVLKNTKEKNVNENYFSQGIEKNMLAVFFAKKFNERLREIKNEKTG